ncbi:MAG: hypothetical protein AB1Z19_02440 [Eubacteriales bacterium]
MMHCKACGMAFKSRERDGEIEVYHAQKRIWTAECPHCHRYGFNDDDDYSYKDDYGYDEDDSSPYDLL